MATVAISRYRVMLLFVGCCSLVTVAMLRLQFLLSQSIFDEPWMMHVHSNNAISINGRQQDPLSKRTSRLRKDFRVREEAHQQKRKHSGLSAQVVVAVQREHAQKSDVKETAASSIYFPNYFTNVVPFETLLERDNMLSVFTGCSIAAWTYAGVTFHRAKVRFYDDCKCHHDERNLAGRDITADTAVALLQSGDTVYVEIKKISHFVQHTLSKIQVDIVLISGQNHLVPQKPQKLDYVWKQEDFDAIVNNHHVTHWFLMNMDVYAQDPNHPKLHPFPYGLGSTGGHTPDTAEVGMNPMHAFKNELGVTNVEKNNTIFVGYFSVRTNRAKRSLVPQGEKLHPTLHFQKMHQSNYVVSPDGDRPDCYRHYEAIGLGAMPITQMNPKYYRHLAGSFIFNNTNWNLTELAIMLPENPRVNRRLVFEEYWMEYVERIVGRPLRWWDPSRNLRCSLAEITDLVKTTSAQ